MTLPLGLRLLQRLSFAWDALWVPHYLRSQGVKLSSDCHFSGCPVVSLFPGSEIHVHQGTRILSRSFATALGVAHPLVLRTLTPDARITIGHNVGISGGSICSAREVEIGNGCLLGADVIITDTDFHATRNRQKMGTNPDQAQAVRLGQNVFVGTRAIILKGVEVGENSVIGAGSVVTRSIPAGVIAAGNPCRVIGPAE